LDGKCTLIRKSQQLPRYGARTGGAQRSSRAPYYGGATHITPRFRKKSPRFRKKSPYYGVGANRWACSETPCAQSRVVYASAAWQPVAGQNRAAALLRRTLDRSLLSKAAQAPAGDHSHGCWASPSGGGQWHVSTRLQGEIRNLDMEGGQLLAWKRDAWGHVEGIGGARGPKRGVWLRRMSWTAQLRLRSLLQWLRSGSICKRSDLRPGSLPETLVRCRMSPKRGSDAIAKRH